MTIPWNDNLSIGIALIDEQHQEIFARVNALLSASTGQAAQGKIGELFEFLDGYTRDHFTFEEEIQQRSGYPRYADHKKMHDGFRNTLGVLKLRHTENPDPHSLRAEVNQFVVDWLIKHISGEDQELAAYILNGEPRPLS